MRIAMLGSKGVPGRHGVEVVVEELGARLVEMGHSVTVFAWESYSPGVRTHRGMAVEPVPGPASGSLAMPFHTLRSVMAVSRSLGSFDAVHVHSVDPFLFARPLVGRIPVVVTSHGRAYELPETGLPGRLMSRIAERAFLSSGCPSTCVSRVLASFYLRMRPGSVGFIPNGARSLGSRSGAVLARSGLEAGRYCVFAAGRTIPSKGLYLLYEGWPSVPGGLDLACAGPPASGRYASLLSRIAPGSGLHQVGEVDAPDLGDLLRGAVLGFHTSLHEAQSMSLLDMLSCGIPVVYSDIPANREVAEGLGVPFAPGDPEDLSRAASVVLDGGFRADAGASRRLLEVHDWDAIVARYLEAYASAAISGSRWNEAREPHRAGSEGG
jgi:glycosyltransferase involved in cell wall biosynthesis